MSATSALGAVEALPVTLVTPTGQSATSAAGTLTTTQLSNVSPTGQSATITLNDSKLILKYYGKLDPKTSTGYTKKTPKNTTGYSVKTPA